MVVPVAAQIVVVLVAIPRIGVGGGKRKVGAEHVDVVIIAFLLLVIYLTKLRYISTFKTLDQPAPTVARCGGTSPMPFVPSVFASS